MIDEEARRGAGIARVISSVAFGCIVLFAGAFPLIVLPRAVADDTDVLPKVLMARAMVVVLALLWGARALTAGRAQLRRTVLDLPVLAVVASAALSTVLSVSPILSVHGTYTRYEGLVTITSYALLFWLMVQFVDTPAAARWVLRAMLAGAALECLLACAQTIVATTTQDLSVFGESATTFDGVARAVGTMGNANNLAIWLALLIPIALYEAVTAARWWLRGAAATDAVLMLVTIVVTFGRAAWLGAAAGGLVTVFVVCARRASARRVTAALAAAGLALAGAATAAARLGMPVVGPAASRLASILDPGAGSGGVRIHLYADTVRMVAERPLVGFGPDTFGLVYPGRAGGSLLPGIVFDKAHSDILQVAATQGLLGVAAEVWLVGALLTTLVRRRHRPGVAAVLGGALAYEVAIQLNFAWFPVTAPFWMVLAAAVVLCGGTQALERPVRGTPWMRNAALAGCALVACGCLLAFAARPALANQQYAAALAAAASGERHVALVDIAVAHAEDPAESQYSAFQGDLEAALVGDRPGPGANLLAARRAYETAIADGDIYSGVSIRLTFVDVALGDQRGALAAAEHARALAPSGPAAKLVEELGG